LKLEFEKLPRSLQKLINERMDGSPKGTAIELNNHHEIIPGGKGIKQIVFNPVRQEAQAGPDRQQQLPDLTRSTHKNL
jgi:hypothetical protein